MVEFAVGDLYDAVASRTTVAVINPAASYECKYCPMFQISGAALRDSDTGRAHAAAHRIAFEALLEPSPVLICPICDLPQKTSEVACVFGCMFNDLDLVEHLEHEHDETLRDEMVCDFSDPRYLLTTFREKRSSSKKSVLEARTSEASSDSTAADDDRNTIVLSDGDVESNADEEAEEKFSPLNTTDSPSNEGAARQETSSAEPAATSMDISNTDCSPPVASSAGEHLLDPPESSTAQDSDVARLNPESECNNNNSEAMVIGTDSNHTKTQEQLSSEPIPEPIVEVEPRPREQMEGVSFVACLVCDWSPQTFSDPHKMREEISSHVRSHIREEANKLPGRADGSFADHRLLSCMDFSLEEYFEKEHLTDLSGTINSRIMERVYSDLLTKLFGICVPVVYRILHGNNGNPFRPPESAQKRRIARLGRGGGKYSGVWSLRNTLRRVSNSTETESSDADSTARDSDDLPGIASYDTDQHIQCARAECGHSLLTPTDRMAVVHHIAAHIRHDESRLLGRAGASPVVSCDCGITVGSPMGYVYHIVHDHVFEHRQFSEIAATILSYLILIVETAIESVLAVRLDFRSTKWTLWCAYFCLEEDEGEEQFFADSTDLNEHWLKLWEDLIDESMTGKNMTLGDTIKLFEMHPFVDEHRLQTRKHKSVPIMYADKLNRSLTKIWRRLNSWAADPVNRIHLAADSRWIQLAQTRRKVLLEYKKGEHGQADLLCRISIKTLGSSESQKRKRSVPKTVCGANRVRMLEATLPVNVTPDTSVTVCSVASVASHPGADHAGTSNEQRDIGELVRCNICADVSISATDAASIKDHCALHAALEGRMLCALYIHRSAERPPTCPFCCLEMNVYKPAEFLDHMKVKHMDKARKVYYRYLHQFFPQSKIFSEPFTAPAESTEEPDKNKFFIRCQRSDCCGVNPVLVLSGEKPVQLAEVDIAIVKHILWHVRNDGALSMDPAERELLTRALMIRLSSAQMRQILFMARRVTKHYRYSEPDVIKYVQAKMNEIGCMLFGVNKGLVFQMVFTRRFVRDQSGMLLYPPCVCRLCVDKELPRYSSDRRKRSFVAYAHPVVLHILEHLSARQLSGKITSLAENMRWKSTCKMEGLRFKSVSAAIKHVLDAHNDIVELSALDLVLEEMGLLEIFRDAMSIVLGEQAWQLEEALGFDAYKLKTCPRPKFLDEEAGADRADCTRHWDLSTPVCTCDPGTHDDPVTSADSSSFRGYRLRTSSLRDMPEASAACYEEFLHGVEAHEGVELPSPNETEQNVQNDMQELNRSTLANEGNSSEPMTVPLTVKVESSEDQGDVTGNRVVTGTPDETSLSLNMPSTSESAPAEEPGRRRRNSKKAQKNNAKEVKREVDGVTVPQRNKALPLKNVIQGSKTVAAALVAALGSPTKTANPTANNVDSQTDATEASMDATSTRSAPVSKSTVSRVLDRNEKDSKTAPAVAVKKPRLASGSENTGGGDNNAHPEQQLKRRLRSSSGRRKSTLNDASSSKN
ncbi:unnamed protein product [Cylicocyclus nassatus]|uniref:Uncharacterized protein n=1 Tax=Cylicocyclus nassatus TaxID=53992 RepID=A0AA36H7J1_CYLNA|nr:unnamed protein product [Cylicocyclus nassatus]